MKHLEDQLTSSHTHGNAKWGNIISKRRIKLIFRKLDDPKGCSER